MLESRKKVKDYFLNGGAAGKYFIDRDGAVYQIQNFEEVLDLAHGGESLGWGVRTDEIGSLNPLDYPRMVNSILHDEEATPEEVQRERGSKLEQIKVDPCATCPQILENKPGESYVCRTCQYKK